MAHPPALAGLAAAVNILAAAAVAIAAAAGGLAATIAVLTAAAIPTITAEAIYVHKAERWPATLYHTVLLDKAY